MEKTKEEANYDNIDVEEILNILKSSRKYLALFNEYRSAIMEVETKLRVLDNELSMDREKNPIEMISTRLKSPESILQKLQTRNLPATYESMKENIQDIAGIRVICDFIDDIYILEKYLTSQTDITVLKRKDYIQNPKPNGYRSLHLTVSVPIFQASGSKQMPVEVQFRTMAMDFWASLEHKLKYKKDIPEDIRIGERLKQCAEQAAYLDREMMDIRLLIDSLGKD